MATSPILYRRVGPLAAKDLARVTMSRWMTPLMEVADVEYSNKGALPGWHAVILHGE